MRRQLTEKQTVTETINERNEMTPLQRIDSACNRIRSGESLEQAVSWEYFQCMPQAEKFRFDGWLVEIQHPQSFVASTAENRFRALVKEFAIRYKLIQ